MTGAAATPPLVPVFAGIDVAKDRPDPARSDAEAVLTAADDDAGIAGIIETLRAAGAAPAAVVVEAAGGLSRPPPDALLDAGLPAALVNPGHVRHSAEGIGRLAETDALDARVPAEFARRAAPRLARKRSKNRAEREALVTCRRRPLHVRTEQSNRRGATASPAARSAGPSRRRTRRSTPWTGGSKSSSSPTTGAG